MGQKGSTHVTTEIDRQNGPNKSTTSQNRDWLTGNQTGAQSFGVLSVQIGANIMSESLIDSATLPSTDMEPNWATPWESMFL